MTQIVAYRRRGEMVWSHIFRVEALNWRSFYRHVRLYRRSMEYARVTKGNYIPVL